MRLSHSVIKQNQASVGIVTDISVRVNVQVVPDQQAVDLYVHI